MPATDEDIIRDLLHQYTDHVYPSASIATEVAARQRHRERRRIVSLAATGTALGAAAGVIAAVPGHSSTPPSALTGTAQASGAHPASTGASTGSTDAQLPLVKLAADVAAEPRPTGDATLVERKTGAPGQASIDVWDLYTDDGRYFFSQTEAGLPAQVKENNNQGDGQFGREVAAATYAVTGDLDTAALKMAWPFATPVPAWLSAQVKNMSVPTMKQIDNYVWENCEDALVAGSGNPQVRAGVLRLVSALPDITVTHGTVDGQPTLTLTAGAAELGDVGIDKANPKAETGPAYQEAIAINANTGIPLGVASGPAGKVVGTVTYAVHRVTLANIEAGKF